MSSGQTRRPATMTLRVFDSQDDSMMEVIGNMSCGVQEGEPFDYLHECVSSLESKDSGINLSPGSHSSGSDLQLDGLNDDYKSSDLSNLDLNFMRIENMLLKGDDSESEAREGAQHEELRAGGTDALIDPGENCLSHPVTDQTCDSKSLGDLEAIRSDTLAFDKDSFIHSLDANEISESSIYSSSNDCYKEYNADCDNNETDKSDSNFPCTMSTDRRETSASKENKTCEQCLMTFRYKRHLDRHLEGHQKNNCPRCHAKFARRKHLEIHLFRTHGERAVRHPHSCDVCSRSFPKKILLNRHRAKHEYANGRVCPECGEMLNTETDDKEHKENHCSKKQFECERCLQTFSIEQTYLSHIQNHETHKCSECDTTFASKRKAQEHFKAVHSAKLDNAKALSNGAYFCADCRHTFLKKDDYFRHLESTLHLSKVNDEVPIRGIFTCSICSKELISQRALDQHVRRIHKGEKRFACNIYGCTFQCARRTDLDRHRQLHVEERNVVCEHCGKTFTSVSILNDHVLYVHNKERQFICEECGKAFKRNSLLKRHKLSHQQYRPFACAQCNTAFKRSHHLTRHLETCHRITLERKKKVMKLMKAEDGSLVPVPEKPKKIKCKKTKAKTDVDLAVGESERPQSLTVADEIMNTLNSELQLQSLSNPENPADSTNLSEFPNFDTVPQVLSLVDVNSGQVVTVEVTSPESLPSNDLVDQFETNCNDILSFSNYQDLEFQNGILSADQNYFDQTNYSELPLENIEGSLLLDASSGKMDTLPTIDNYLTQPFPSFLNL